MIKNTCLNIFLLLLVVSTFDYGQTEHTDSVKTIKSFLQPGENILFNTDEFSLYCRLYSQDINIPVNNNPNTIWLWTTAAISNTGAENSQIDIEENVSSLLYRQYLKNSKFNAVRYVLGMAQLGAVGYLAYKHIRKYGFLK